MKVASLFTGAGGFDKALERCGMKVIWQAEIDRQCRSVTARHWPDVTMYDDVRRVRAYLEPKNARRTAIRPERPDLLCGGFPCQDISVAGRRAGLAGSRSGLWFTFRRIAALVRPRWLLIENVDGLRSSNKGRDLGAILKALGDMGYGWAYRVFDSQWFGLAQRRERVFIVGCFGNWRRASEVLFERDCLPWHPAPSRDARQTTAACLTSGAHPGGHNGQDDSKDGRLIVTPIHNTDIGTLPRDRSRDGAGIGSPGDPMFTVQSRPRDAIAVTPIDMRQASRGAKLTNNRPGGSSGGAPGTGIGELGDPAFTLCDSHPVAIAFAQNQRDEVRDLGDLAGSVSAQPGMKQQTYVAYRTSGNCGVMQQGDKTACLNTQTDPAQNIVQSRHGVRRLTPREYERLQGFEDDWTRWDADGNELSDSPRYRMMGNAVSIPPVEWIGRRIVEAAA